MFYYVCLGPRKLKEKVGSYFNFIIDTQLPLRRCNKCKLNKVTKITVHFNI